MQPSTDRLLNINEAAELLQLHFGTLACWRSYHKGPTFIKTKNRILYPYNDLVRFATANGYEINTNINTSSEGA